MAIKKYNPVTPSRRFMTWYSFDEITTSKPYKPLTTFLWSTAWRNNQGRITARFMWGGHKRLYRIVDTKGYDKENIPAKVATIEYDPYRTSRIALVNYADGEKRYVIARKWIAVGDEIIVGKDWPIKPWNRKQLKDIPEWLSIFNLEVTPLTKGKLIKSAGSFATIVWRDESLHLVFVKMPSGEVRKFNEKCWATIGEVGNEDHKNIVIGKAWRQRRLGRKPRVLGVSMNPVDHPHGGWEWHTWVGLKYPKAFNGRIVAPGMKTRKNSKWSSKFIVSRRTKN